MAREHRISPLVVHRLVKKAQQRPKLIDELIAERDRVQMHRVRISAAVTQMNTSDEVIDSVAMATKHIREQHQLEATEREVASMMRDDLGMRYKKIKAASLHANSVKNLVLRQQFGLKLLEQLEEKKTILNVDQSWLGITDFRRQKWCPANGHNSVP